MGVRSVVSSDQILDIRSSIYARTDGQSAALPEPANGPNLSSEAIIGIAWTTNNLDRLRFDSSSVRVRLQATTKSYLAAHRCVWPAIAAPSVTVGYGTDAVRSGRVEVTYLPVYTHPPIEASWLFGFAANSNILYIL